MKTLTFIFTLLASSFSFAVTTSGAFATEKVLRELGSDVLYGKTAANKPCVVDVVLPNRYHEDTVVRVYPGSRIDDVPEEAAWIRIHPKGQAEYEMKRYSLLVRSTEIKPDEEGYTKIMSHIYVGYDPMLEKKIVTIKTQSLYVHASDRNARSSYRKSLMTCYIGR